MKTAVEWLENVFWNNYGEITSEHLEQAKEMERKQIMDAHFEGSEDYRRQYYNETFKQEQ